VETNIVVFPFADAAWLCAELERRGVRMGVIAPGVVRAVTHLDVDRTGIEKALAVASEVLARQPLSTSER
jgi:threonine aldolase